MNIEEYGAHLKETLDKIVICAAPGTYLHRIGIEIEEMIQAYFHDGMVFFCDGDLVNALASYTYGAGWLDAGCFIGIIMADTNGNLSNPHFEENMPPSLKPHLLEKTQRYLRMAYAAIEVIEYAPDYGSTMYTAAEKIRDRAFRLIEGGFEMNQQESNINALGLVSYGYGMLDAGVRAGLFDIMAKRHLFTI